MRLLLIFILFVQLYTTVFGVQTVYISPFGSNQNPGTQEEPFLTLAQALLNITQSNSFIYCFPGSYTGFGNIQVTINEPGLTIAPTSNIFESVIFSGGDWFFNAKANITGITFAYFNTGINVQMPNVLINIQDCTFLGNKNSAAFTVSTGPNVQYNITKSLISGGKYGLFANLYASSYVFAFGTTFQGLTYPFYTTQGTEIILENSMVQNCNSSISPIFLFNSILSASSSNFTNNIAQFGGVINANSTSVNLINCTLTNNHASNSGGVIYLSNKSVLFAETSIFDTNSASTGAVAQCDSNSLVFASECILANNSDSFPTSCKVNNYYQ